MGKTNLLCLRKLFPGFKPTALRASAANSTSDAEDTTSLTS